MDSDTTDLGRVIDINQIMDMIPHRYPFLLLDKVTNIVRGESAVGIKNVTINEPFFQGHFPNHPIMPGVLLIEAMAQTSAIIVIDSTGNKAGNVVYFMSVDSAKFRRPVGPGDRVELHVSKIQSRGTVWKFKGEAIVDGKKVADATYSAMIVED